MADDWDDTAADGGTDLEVGLPKLTSFAIIGSFAILVCACLYIARDLFVPLALALLIYLTLTPLVRYLSLKGVPDFRQCDGSGRSRRERGWRDDDDAQRSLHAADQ